MVVVIDGGCSSSLIMVQVFFEEFNIYVDIGVLREFPALIKKSYLAN